MSYIKKGEMCSTLMSGGARVTQKIYCKSPLIIYDSWFAPGFPHIQNLCCDRHGLKHHLLNSDYCYSKCSVSWQICFVLIHVCINEEYDLQLHTESFLMNTWMPWERYAGPGFRQSCAKRAKDVSSNKCLDEKLTSHSFDYLNKRNTGQIEIILPN